MQVLTLLKSLFSLDALVYLAIFLVTMFSMMRCLVPLSRTAAKLRRAARTIIMENKQNKEKNKKKAGIVELHQKRPPLRKEGRPRYCVFSDDQYSIFERRT